MATNEDVGESREIVSLLEADVCQFIAMIKYAKWDNLCGPKIIKVWDSQTSQIDLDCLVYVSNHILNGEVWRLTQEESFELKLYIFSGIELITLSAIFLMVGDVYSLSFLFPISHMQYYVPLHCTFCKILRDSFSSNSSSDKIYDIDKILINVIPEFINIRYNSVNLSINESLLTKRISLDRFLQTCLSSHLQTGTYSVVCGKNARHLRSMIQTLSFFMLDEDRCLTQTYSGKDIDFRPYLLLQAYSNLETAKEQLLRFGKQRVTLIDLDNNCVQVFQANLTGKIVKTPEAFVKVRGRAKLIKDLCNDIDIFPNIPIVKELYVRDFLRLLMKKALALLSLENILREFESKSDYDPGLLFSQLKQDLLLDRDEDLGIILAIAHRICPSKTGKMLNDFVMISASQVEIKSIL